MEDFVIENLKNYKEINYFLHLAENDELFEFSGLLGYLSKYLIPHNIFHYNTNHRFEEMNKMLVNCNIQ